MLQNCIGCAMNVTLYKRQRIHHSLHVARFPPFTTVVVLAWYNVHRPDWHYVSPVLMKIAVFIMLYPHKQ